MTVVGTVAPLAGVNNQEAALHRKSVAGSLIGSIAETQEVLDVCATHQIGPDIQVIAIQNINDACKKVEDGDGRFCFVLDTATLKQDTDCSTF